MISRRLESGGENSGWSSRIIPRPLFWTGRIASALIGPAAFALAVACCLPWAHVVILHTVDVSVPGILFESGCRIFAAAVGILLVRRLPVFSLIAAGFAYSWLASAASDVPHRVMHQVIGVQLSLFPINRLLDQFHLPNIEFANTFAPRKTDLLTPAFTWSRTALQALLLLSLLAIPADPALIWIARRVVPAQCRACGKRWKATRDAAFCPECGTPVHRTPRIVCSRCGTAARKGDKHCVKCGETLEA